MGEESGGRPGGSPVRSDWGVTARCLADRLGGGPRIAWRPAYWYSSRRGVMSLDGRLGCRTGGAVVPLDCRHSGSKKTGEW